MTIKQIKNKDADTSKSSIKSSEINSSSSKEIPPVLMQNVQTLIGGIVVCVACILFGMTSFGFFSFITFIGLILIAVLGTYAIILYRTYSKGNYDCIEGMCKDAHKAGWRKQYWQIIITDDKGNTYSVNTVVKKRYRILPGDKVVVYVPKGLEMTENVDGIYEINEVYGATRYR